MNTNLSAAELRSWADQCDRQSQDPMITGGQQRAANKDARWPAGRR
jgi:hypothetical protein